MKPTCILVLLMVPAVASCQSRRSSGSSTPEEDLLATFTGTVQAIHKKTFAIQPLDSRNTLEFYCSKKTRYYSGDKETGRSVLQKGAEVSVEARRGLDGTLDAVHVTLKRHKSSALKPSS